MSKPFQYKGPNNTKPQTQLSKPTVSLQKASSTRTSSSTKVPLPSMTKISSVPVKNPAILAKPTALKSQQKPIKLPQVTQKAGIVAQNIQPQPQPLKPTQTVPIVKIKKKAQPKIKSLHEFYTTKNWRIIRLRRIYVRKLPGMQNEISRSCFKFLSKRLENLTCDLRPVTQHRGISSMINPYITPKSYHKDCHAFSPNITKVDLDLICGKSKQVKRNREFCFLKRLKNVKTCIISFDTLVDFKLLVYLIKRWRNIQTLFVKGVGIWGNKYWKCLEKVLGSSVKTLGLSMKLNVDAIKGLELARCTKKIRESQLDAVNLELEVENEIIVDYFLGQSGYFKGVKTFALKCNGASINSNFGMETYQFCHLVDNIVPRTLEHMEKLEKVTLDFSNNMFCCYTVKDEQIKKLCEKLKCAIRLIELELKFSNHFESENYISNWGLEYIVQLVAELPAIEVIYLGFSNTNISNKGVLSLLKTTMNIPTLKSLKVSAIGTQVKSRDLEKEITEFKKKSKAVCTIVSDE